MLDRRADHASAEVSRPARSREGRVGSRPRARSAGRAERTNERWIADLRSSGPERERAVEDLVEYLQAGLARAIGSSDNVEPHDIEDFTQDAVVRILEALETFRGTSRFTTWAMTIALRASYSALRARRSADVSLGDIEGYGRALRTSSSEPRSPEKETLRNDLYEALRLAVMEQLTERQRTVILAEMRGVASTRVAEILGTNRNAVYKVYYDARKSLRRALTDAGFTADDVRSILAGT